MTTPIRIRKADVLLPLVDEMLRFARGRLAKAALPTSLAARGEFFAEAQPAMAAELVDHFDGLLSRAGVHKDVAFPFDPDTDVDWEDEKTRLRVVLERWYVVMGDAAYAALGDQLGIELTFDLAAAPTKGIRHLIGVNVASITDTTLELLRNRVEDAIARGLSIEELVAGTDTVQGLRELFGSRAETIALTETATAFNLASAAGYKESGLVDEVEIFDGDECGWDGHDDPDLADGSIRTLEEFTDMPTSHPNCFPGETLVVAPGANASFARWFEGDLVVVKTATGRELAATPNHPVLTRRGWLPLALLEHGDDLVCASDPERIAAAIDPDHEHVPTSIAEVAHSLPVILPSVPATAEDFHGDASDGDVYVVRADRLLKDGIQPAAAEPVGEFALGRGDIAREPAFSAERPSSKIVRRALHAADRSMGGRRHSRSLAFVGAEAQQLGRAVVANDQAEGHEPTPELSGCHARLAGKLPAALAGHVALMERTDAVSVNAQVAAAPDANGGAPSVDGPTQGLRVYSEHAGDLRQGLAGHVEFDRVVNRRRVGFAGHVYNLSTDQGWYIAAGVIVHNCQRAAGPVVVR